MTKTPSYRARELWQLSFLMILSAEHLLAWPGHGRRGDRFEEARIPGQVNQDLGCSRQSGPKPGAGSRFGLLWDSVLTRRQLAFTLPLSMFHPEVKPNRQPSWLVGITISCQDTYPRAICDFLSRTRVPCKALDCDYYPMSSDRHR
jgi:hypothetical protein